jgi:hypothetical protein
MLVNTIVRSRLAVLLCAFILAALGSIQILYGAHQPRMTRRDTLRLVDSRRYAVKPFDERDREIKNYRPTLGQSRWFNGQYRYSTHYQTTNKAMHTNSGLRAVQDRQGKLIVNNNRTQMVRRRSTRQRW